jgi:hypothetical protein
MSASKQEERKKEKRNLTFKDLYEQGSKCCQQYSALTMQIRTLAQYIMIAYTVGISLAISRASSPNPEMPSQDLHQILFVAGLVVSSFAIVLGILNHHYSTAFTEIRDSCLVRLENQVLPYTDQPKKPWKEIILQLFKPRRKEEPATERRPVGPWQAQRNVRKREGMMRWLSWYSPFLVLFIFGVLGILAGRRWWLFN